MKGIIVYKGKYGATQQYAEWAAAEMKLPVFASHECGQQDIADCDYLVLGTSVYIGVMVLKEWIKENMVKLTGKKIFLFVVSGTDLNEKEQLEMYVHSSVPEQLRKQCDIYFLPGKLNYKKRTWSDKILLRVGAILSGNANKRKAMLTGYDAVKKDNIMPMISDINSFNKSRSLDAVA